jgi:hypothetical protein
MATDPRRFRFAPMEQRGLIAGLRSGQVAVLAVGAVIAVGVLRASASPLAILLALAVASVTVGLAFVSVGGRSVEQWAPVAVRFGARRLTSRDRTAPAAPPAGGVGPSTGRTSVPGFTDDGGGASRAGGPLPVPAHLGHLTFFQADRAPGGDPIGVIHDLRGGVLSAVIAVRGRAFALLDMGDKEQRLAAWASVLTAMAREGSPVHRLQWVERTVGGDAEALHRHFELSLAIDPAAPAARSYRELVAEAGPLTEEHECYVALSIRIRRRWRGWLPARRQNITQHGPLHDGVALLQRELRLLEGQLRNADIEVHAPCSIRAIAAVVRTAFAPDQRIVIARRASAHDREGPTMAAVWPAATETRWDSYRTDDYWHATFWVAEWPRVEVGPDFLSPLLLHGGGWRTVALVMAPIPPSQGVREVEAARTASAADDELRRRAGFLGTARRLRESEGVARREMELSEGHSSYRFSGYVTVTGATHSQLQDRCAHLVQVANQCRLDLRRLHGAQDVAFSWTLPFGLGLG